MRALPMVNVSVSDEALYKAGTVPFGSPADESQALSALGLTNDGTMIYLWR